MFDHGFDLLRKLLKKQGRVPRVMITDKLASYSAAKAEVMPSVEHRRHKGLYGAIDVKVRVHLTGICGTDLYIYEWDEWAKSTIPVPMVIGH